MLSMAVMANCYKVSPEQLLGMAANQTVDVQKKKKKQHKFETGPQMAAKSYSNASLLSADVTIYPASILRKSTAGRHWPVSYPDGPMTARYRFTLNADWVPNASLWETLDCYNNKTTGAS